MASREQFGSRLGFIFLAAACAIGLGNIWRFPYITGKYGGAVFVILYLLCLAVLAFPILVMELAVGRGSLRNLAGAYDILKSPDSRFNWSLYGKIFFTGNALLMMFYTTVSGWLVAYMFFYLNGDLAACPPGSEVGKFFSSMTGSPGLSVTFMLATTVFAAVGCAFGLRRGVERITKFLMFCLLGLIVVLCIKALTLPGAPAAMKFYLAPDFESLKYPNIIDTLYAAVGQAFFTLSLGVGSIAIFGSYTSKNHTLVKEGFFIAALDTTVAIAAGLIIFPICFSYSGDPAEGPGLIFVALPNMFNSMLGGRWWGAAFFFFMTIAALTTVLAVFENMIAYLIDQHGTPRPRAALLVGTGIFLLSLPCALGFNLLKFIQPMGANSTILDLEDFILSQNILPLGALYILFFCFYGWGWKKFLAEADIGEGPHFPVWSKNFLKFLLPAILLAIFATGYYTRFFR